VSIPRRRTLTWLGVPVAVLVTGGPGLAVASAASHPVTTRLADTAAHASATPSARARPSTAVGRAQASGCSGTAVRLACSGAGFRHAPPGARPGAAVSDAPAVGRPGATGLDPAVARPEPVQRGAGSRPPEAVARPEPVQRGGGTWRGPRLNPPSVCSGCVRGGGS
jgi:hypothetical protein